MILAACQKRHHVSQIKHQVPPFFLFLIYSVLEQFFSFIHIHAIIFNRYALNRGSYHILAAATHINRQSSLA